MASGDEKVKVLLLLLTCLLAVGALAVGALASSAHSEGFAHFSNMKQAAHNQLYSGSVISFLSGEPIRVEGAWPSEWFEQEWLLTNTGSEDRLVSVHLRNLNCFEDVLGAGATAEPELATESGATPVGEDADGNPIYACNDPTQPTSAENPPLLGADRHDLATHVDAELYFDSTLKWAGKLSDLECQTILLGTLPGAMSIGKKGGWGVYWTYCQGSGTAANPVVAPLIAGQNWVVGEVRVWDTAGKLYVTFDTTASGWEMEETHLYIGMNPPQQMAPGQFPYKHPSVYSTTDSYGPITLPAACIYIAAHAAGTDGETAWAFPPGKKFKLRLHFPDVDEDDLGFHLFDETIPAEAKWDHWPTNAYMGDYCRFDLEFILN